MATKRSIFLAYRATDDARTIQTIGRIADRLGKHFGAPAIQDGPRVAIPGTDISLTVGALMPRQGALLVPIGPQWLDATSAGGGRSLDDPYDPVRLEIEAALRHNVPMIPLLLGAAKHPAGTTLPPSLVAMAGYPSMHVREDPDFTEDMTAIITSLGRWVKPLPVTSPDTSGRAARFYGLLLGFLLIPALALFTAILAAFSNVTSSGQSSSSTSSVLGWIGAVLFFVTFVVMYLLAGVFAARRTGLARTGAVAGMIASSVNGLLVLLCAAFGAISAAAGYRPHDTGWFPGLGLFLGVVAVVAAFAWLLLGLGLGAAFGALGGAIGRRAYQGAAPAVAATKAPRRAAQRA